MIPRPLIDLALRTVQNPQDAARQILTYGLSRDALWTALALVGAINTILFTLSLQMTPPPPEFPSVFSKPLAFYVILTGSMVVIVHALFWTGRALGGKGELGDLLGLIVWLQVLRAAAQAALLVITIVSPGIAALLALGVGLFGIWLLVNFIAAGLRFASLAPAVLTLVGATLGALLGAVVLGTLIGLAVIGVPTDV
ncbi:MAG: YIP1 family protein [Sulfitobacter sp.]